MKNLINEAKRMQQLAGILKEDTQQEKYYAVIDIHGNPRTLEANSKEEMLDMLNKTYKESTGEEYEPYSLGDLEDDFYNNKKLDHVISDDWAMVTNDINVFNTDKNTIKSLHKKT